MPEEIKHYSPREEKLNFFTHFTGFLLACAGFFPLRDLVLKHGGSALYTAVVFYSFSLMAMFFISMCYHREKNEEKRLLFRRFDHCAIYWAITGTYAPLIFGAVRSTAGYWLFGGLAGLSAAGTAGKFLFGHRFHRIEVAIYMLMGWGCLCVAGKMLHSMSRHSLILLLAGGIAYSGGLFAYASRREFSHALWHIFVLCGVGLHYFAILTMFD